MAETAAVVIAAAGVGLLYAAITNQNPVTELRAALATGSTAGATPIRSGTFQPAGAPSGGLNVPTGSTSTTGPTLVTIGQGSHRLTPAAAQGFKRFEQAFGAPLAVTDSYRSVTQQTADYNRDPARFANPANSRHVRGTAVDINLGAIGARPTGANPSTWTRDPVYARLIAAANSAGWCNYQVRNGSTGSKIPEPWHFSFGDCG